MAAVWKISFLFGFIAISNDLLWLGTMGLIAVDYMDAVLIIVPIILRV
jgi:hypothetical protein